MKSILPKDIAILKDRKVLTLLIGAVVVLLLFVTLVHMPKRRAVNELKVQIKNIEQQIRLTEAMLGDLKRLGFILVDMQKELALFEKRIPGRKHVSSVISEFTNLAKICCVEVVSMKPEEPKPFLDENKQPITLDKKPLEYIRGSLKLTGSYKALAEYIKRIQESTNILAKIDEIYINKNSAIAPQLNAEVVLNVYIVGED